MDGYENESVDGVLAFSDSENAYQALYVLEKAIERQWKKSPGMRTGVENIIVAGMAVIREVNNGGFDLFYRNSSKRWAFFARSALVHIGRSDAAKIVGVAHSVSRANRTARKPPSLRPPASQRNSKNSIDCRLSDVGRPVLPAVCGRSLEQRGDSRRDRPFYLAVIGGVMLAGFFGVMNRIDVMAVGDVCVMAGFLMIAGSVMLGCRTMVLGGFFVVLCGFHMVIRSRFRHG
jgi:hypothetical protein